MDEMEKTLNKEFPNAITIKELFDKIDSAIGKLGFEHNQVKTAKAICRDDSVEEIGKELFNRGYPNAFSMQTLSGLPVFGVTGMVAYYHHIPDDGLGFIIYAPHIGIDSNGRLGYLDRHGIKEPGKSCGANHAIIGHWKKGDVGPYENDPELSGVSSRLKESKDRILKEKDPLLALTELEYKVGLETLSSFISKVQKSEHHKYPILVFAGINIDIRSDEINRFQLRDKKLFKDGIATNYS